MISLEECVPSSQICAPRLGLLPKLYILLPGGCLFLAVPQPPQTQKGNDQTCTPPASPPSPAPRSVSNQSQHHPLP